MAQPATHYDNIYDIIDHQTAYDGLGKAYGDKQLHKIPEMSVVDRRKFIIQRAKDKVVLDVGCSSGTLHQEINESAQRVFGLDKESTGTDVIALDLDIVDSNQPKLPFPAELGINMVVCGEVLEHLCNPGWFLTRVRNTFPEAEVIISVPNAYSSGGQSFNQRGIENVNLDHVAWYSYHTLKVLLEKSNFSILKCHWYHGKPNTAEGLVCIAKANPDLTTTVNTTDLDGSE